MRDKGEMENGTVESDEKERAWRPWLDPARRKVGVTVEIPRYGICSAPGGCFLLSPEFFCFFSDMQYIKVILTFTLTLKVAMVKESRCKL